MHVTVLPLIPNPTSGAYHTILPLSDGLIYLPSTLRILFFNLIKSSNNIQNPNLPRNLLHLICETSAPNSSLFITSLHIGQLHKVSPRMEFYLIKMTKVIILSSMKEHYNSNKALELGSKRWLYFLSYQIFFVEY